MLKHIKGYIYVGDGKTIEVEEIRKFILLLNIGFYLNLNKTFIVPSFRSNLISISTLDKSSFSCFFGIKKFNLFCDSKLVAFSSLSVHDHLHLIDTIALFNESLKLSTQDIKRKLINENLAALSHKKVLDPLDFIDFDVFFYCIKGKQTNKRRFEASKTSNVLELIHMNICWTFPIAA